MLAWWYTNRYEVIWIENSKNIKNMQNRTLSACLDEGWQNWWFWSEVIYVWMFSLQNQVRNKTWYKFFDTTQKLLKVASTFWIHNQFWNLLQCETIHTLSYLNCGVWKYLSANIRISQKRYTSKRREKPIGD